MVVALALAAWGLVGAPAAATVAPRLTDLAISQIVPIDGGFAVTVPEVAQNADLNGDAVLDDVVVFAVLPGQASVNTGLTMAPLAPYAVPGGFAIFEPETALGHDATGDGDTTDTVLATWDPTHGVTALPYALGGGYYPARPVTLTDGSRAMYLSEAGEEADLNGDGDQLDSVFHVLRTDGTLVDVGYAGAYFNPMVPLPGGGVAFTVGEADQNHTDLNLDGDSTDGVVAVWTDGGGVTQTRLATNGMGGAIIARPDGLLVLVTESLQHADLNGDGDQSDSVPALWTSTTTTVIPAAVATTSVLSTGQVAFGVDESAQGNTDRNGDGDHTDRVVAIWDPAHPSSLDNLGIASYSTAALPGGALLITTADGSLVVWTASGPLHTAPFSSAFITPRIVDATHLVAEAREGATDRNGDGDVLDDVPAVWDWAGDTAVYGGVALLPSSGVGIAPDGSFLVGVSESAQGADVNGDGDATDVVLRLWSPTAGFGPLSVATGNPYPVVSGGWIGYTVNEAADGGRDRNGDGDNADMLLGLYGDLPDGTAPVITGLTVTPAEVPPFGSVVVTAHVEDTSSTITRAALRYGATQLTMTAVDGAYDETAEDVRATFSASGFIGSYPVCVFARDAAGVESAVSCATQVVAWPSDTAAPTLTSLTVTPQTVRVSDTVTVSATGDDRTTGGSSVSVEAATGASWATMTPADGAFDSSLETATTTTSFATIGPHTILVRARDAAGNVGTTYSIDVLAYEPFGMALANGAFVGNGKKDLTIHLNARYTDTGERIGTLSIEGADVDLRADTISALAVRPDGVAYVWTDALLNGALAHVRITLTDRKDGGTIAVAAVLDDRTLAFSTTGTLRTGGVTVRT